MNAASEIVFEVMTGNAPRLVKGKIGRAGKRQRDAAQAEAADAVGGPLAFAGGITFSHWCTSFYIVMLCRSFIRIP
ncbi:hypothetical protein D3C73_1316000 [compost metagenome]